MHLFALAFLLLALLAPVTAHAKGKWTTYANANYISSIAVQGEYIWCASSGGVVRWDARDMSYVQYATPDGLPDNRVVEVGIAPDRTVWASTNSGIVRFQSGRWETIPFPENLFVNGGPDMAFGPDGSVWFAHNMTVARYSDGKVTEYSLDTVKPFCPAQAVTVSPDGTVWVGTCSGLVRYRDTVWEVDAREINIFSMEAAPDGSVWCSGLLIDQRLSRVFHYGNGIWRDYNEEFGVRLGSPPPLSVAHDGGIWIAVTPESSEFSILFRHDGASWESTASSAGEGPAACRSFALADDGTVWLGNTKKGLFRWDGEHLTNYLTDCRISGNYVESLAVEQDGTVWAGSQSLINRYDGHAWQTFTASGESVPFNASVPYNKVISIAAVPGNGVWFGSFLGAAQYRDGTWMKHQWKEYSSTFSVTSMTIGPQKCLWFGLLSGVCRYDGESWRTFTPSDGLAETNIRAIAAGPDGEVWAVIQRTNSVFRFDGIRWADFSSVVGLADTTINDITVGLDGNAWFTTQNGIKRYDGYQIHGFTTANGLPDNWTTCIATAPSGDIWAGTGKGAARFNGTEWETFTTDDGLAHNSVLVIAPAPDGSVWFGTQSGISRFEPDISTRVEEQAASPVALAITGNRPNPFNPSTTITFSLPAPGRANLTVYSITGQKIRELLSGHYPAGMHPLVWDGRDDSGAPVSSGVYISRLVHGRKASSARMLLMK